MCSGRVGMSIIVDIVEMSTIVGIVFRAGRARALSTRSFQTFIRLSRRIMPLAMDSRRGAGKDLGNSLRTFSRAAGA